jgi:hypothetical protein
VYLCLNADRHTGRLVLDQTALAHALRKTKGAIGAALIELTNARACSVRGSEIEIADRFWPYERQTVVTEEEQTEFVRQVRAELMAPACVNSTFRPAEEDLAIGLYRRGVSLELVRRAIWLASARKYMALLNRQTRETISSLRYFVPAMEEVSEMQVPVTYWEHVRQKALDLQKSSLAGGQTQNRSGNED